MEKITIFTSSKCPDCDPVLEKLVKEGIKFENIDISNSIPELKKFLKVRENEEYFNKIKAEGFVGVPTIMTDDGKFYNPEDMDNFDIFK